jgi:DNA-binding winged helix-turn-helix (wHTH) protein
MKDDPAILERSAPIDLAREAPFALGAAAIRPSLSEVVADGQTIRLQPRVMQVLVALVRANGEVVSRDDLVASCWGGLIIGDDAINRCIGRLRRLAEDEAPASFTIETLTRIGYRLTPTGGVEGAISPPRRHRPPPWGLAVGALILIGLAGGWIALGRPGWPQPDAGVAVMPFDTAPGDRFPGASPTASPTRSPAP